MGKTTDEIIQNLILDYYAYTNVLRPYLTVLSLASNNKRFADALHDRAITSIDIASGYRDKKQYNTANNYILGAITDAKAGMATYEALGNYAMKSSCERIIAACNEHLVTLAQERIAHLQVPPTPPRTIFHDNNTDGYTTGEDSSPEKKNNTRSRENLPRLSSCTLFARSPNVSSSHEAATKHKGNLFNP